MSYKEKFYESLLEFLDLKGKEFFNYKTYEYSYGSEVVDKILSVIEEEESSCSNNTCWNGSYLEIKYLDKNGSERNQKIYVTISEFVESLLDD